jgi:hypothetical protein
MKKRKTSSFLNDPVGVGAILDEKLSNEETDFFVLKTVTFFDKSIEHSRQRVIIEWVGFINFSEGHYEKPHNFIVAIHACDNQRSLFVTAGLLINIDVFVSQ